MNKVFISIFLNSCLFLCSNIQAQNTDTSTIVANNIAKDSALQARQDSLYTTSNNSWKINILEPIQEQILLHHSYYNFKQKPKTLHTSLRVTENKDSLFYCIILLTALFAILKTIFPKYVADLMKLFFRTSQHKQQLADLLIQNILPSLWFNILFVFSAGLFVTLLLQNMYTPLTHSFWYIYLYSFSALAIVYTLKFVIFKFFGWVLSLSETTNSYIFLVFLQNKFLGIALLPFIFLLAFSQGTILKITLILSLIILAIIVVFRFILGIGTINKKLKISYFHFILFILAIEILPLVLIYKMMFVVN